MLRQSLDAAKLGDPEKLDGFRRLDRFVRAVERRCRMQADFVAVLAHERAISPALDGRTAAGPVRSRAQTGVGQLSLFPPGEEPQIHS